MGVHAQPTLARAVPTGDRGELNTEGDPTSSFLAPWIRSMSPAGTTWARDPAGVVLRARMARVIDRGKLESARGRLGMSGSRFGVGDELIVGGLRLDPAEVQQVSREATADNRRFIVLHGFGIALAAAAAAANWLEGEGLRSFRTPLFILALSVSGLIVQARSRSRRIADILRSQPSASAVDYQLDTSGIQIHSDAGPTQRLAWSQCRVFDESAHAFFLYAGRVDPEIMYKRAFPEDVLPAVRERLGTNVKKRALGRALTLSFVIGFAVLAVGILVGVAMRSGRP